jgi:hypothetical protein
MTSLDVRAEMASAAAVASAMTIISAAATRRPRTRAPLKSLSPRSTSVKAPSMVSASNAEGMAPARMTVESTMDRPRKMYSPSPPAPTAAAIVAVPTPMTAATRMPATIDGNASGNSTWRIN